MHLISRLQSQRTHPSLKPSHSTCCKVLSARVPLEVLDGGMERDARGGGVADNSHKLLAGHERFAFPLIHRFRSRIPTRPLPTRGPRPLLLAVIVTKLVPMPDHPPFASRHLRHALIAAQLVN